MLLQLKTYKSDPSRTKTLRDAFAREMRVRFNELARVIRITGEEDLLQLNKMNLPDETQFAFTQNEKKIEAFEKWLQRQVDLGILEIEAGTQGAWTNKYVKDSYKRGVIRARYELKKAGAPVGSFDAASLMNAPFHADRLAILYTRAYTELKAITSIMEQQIMRVFTQGIADGDNPRVIARKLNKVITGAGEDLGITDTLGRYIPARRRAEMMARTEVIRAHHKANMAEYKSWRAEGVSIKAEWQTAGDERVCSRCQGLQGRIFTLEQAENMIPVHPMCRCAAVPYNPEWN